MPDSNYKNLASAVIPTAGTTSDNSVVISATDGATFPSAPFYATIMPATGLANATNSEIVKVTAVATAGANTTFTVTRAQRNTSAISWSANGAIICHTVYTEDVAPLKDAAFIGSVLSTPSSVAYVATDNIQDGAVTSQKIDYTTLAGSTLTPAAGYSTAFLIGKKLGGSVHFESSVSIPSITTGDNQTVAFTLPVGWRPSATCNFIAIAYTGTSPIPLARVRIHTDGTVKISKIDQDLPSGVYVQFGQISYIAV